MSEGVVIDVALQVLEALEYLHGQHAADHFPRPEAVGHLLAPMDAQSLSTLGSRGSSFYKVDHLLINTTG